MALEPGITARTVPTTRLSVNVLERTDDDPSTPDDRTVVLVHGNVSSALFWQEIMLALPEDLRVLAVDLRGFGETEALPVDASRGCRDYSDDIHATLEALGCGPVHLVGWSLGGGVVMQYALDHPVLSLTLQAPVSPYGFGGTRRDGTLLTQDGAGTGGGGANPDFVQRIIDRDTSADAPTSPRSVFRSGYVAPGYTSEHEDLWVESMLSTATGVDHYPGDSVPSESWPGFAAGTRGVLNTLAPTRFSTAGLVDLEVKPPILWIHGSADAIVSDASFFDLNMLGKAGLVPGWPGDEVAPPQPMVSQTRDVLEAYARAGGRYTEVLLEGVGHSPHLERPAEFVEALVSWVRG
ncbi:alpha/beta hydrolase [Isoptericola sp. b441]|uniref:Alpha/beta hydrolase n=1 Tax=Actinotalea lenta TaxID=3064654 RepID=A0ABT9D9L1_9CELL|nr:MULTISPECIES: alpha/beta hydrolase [unclassified Isoptericola]MDO8107587.1 alpha/beta hydrolase [Isoptericola sp. b441]MDO8120753.1 alpha/beta hydrolase [Isoptericola sp. b490]